MVSLVARYAPRSLQEIRGQSHVVHGLAAFTADPCSGAFLFTGDTGVGKTATAHVLAAELGCDIDQRELGGMYEIPSGEQDAESVRKVMAGMRLRPMFGSGWRVLIVNECDRMSTAAEVIWLDALEALPERCVVIFTTNNPEKLSQRFVDRCETVEFSPANPNDCRQLAAFVWKRETGQEIPGSYLFAAGDAADGRTLSYRATLQRLSTALRSPRPVSTFKPAAKPAPAAVSSSSVNVDELFGIRR
jgi:replication-associated recombination protein RarA